MFVPEDFAVPTTHSNDRLRLRMLSVEIAEKDYEAVVESRIRLRKSSQHEYSNCFQYAFEARSRIRLFTAVACACSFAFRVLSSLASIASR